MARLTKIEVCIAGEYRDAWLYKQRLYAWDRSGGLTYVDLEVAARYVARRYGAAVGNVVQTLIFRNDWKVGEQFRAMMRVPEMQAAFLQPFRESDAVTIELPVSLFSTGHSEAYNGT